MIKLLTFQKSFSHAFENDIKAFEAELELKLPSAFVEFCLKYNGGFPSDENSYYPVPQRFGAFHKEYGAEENEDVGVAIDGLFGLGEDSNPCSLQRQLHSFRSVSRIKLFPIAYELLGNHVVLREDDLNGIVYWRDHELWEAPDVPALFPIADNLEVFYNALTRDPYLEEN